jgi:hypothetical protein
MTPQNQKGAYKRLSFETLGGDDYVRLTRVSKGIHREIMTPKLSVPQSREGTEVYKQVDRNEIAAAVLIRSLVTQMIVKWYPVVTLKKVYLAYASAYTSVQNTYQVTYNKNYGVVSPETYYNG